MMDALIYLLSYAVGGFALGVIFLSYFDNITESHVYMAIIGASAFILNFFVTEFVLSGQVSLTGIIASLIIILQFSIFLSCGYVGRKVGRRLKHIRRGNG